MIFLKRVGICQNHPRIKYTICQLCICTTTHVVSKKHFFFSNPPPLQISDYATAWYYAMTKKIKIWKIKHQLVQIMNIIETIGIFIPILKIKKCINECIFFSKCFLLQSGKLFLCSYSLVHNTTKIVFVIL